MPADSQTKQTQARHSIPKIKTIHDPFYFRHNPAYESRETWRLLALIISQIPGRIGHDLLFVMLHPSYIYLHQCKMGRLAEVISKYATCFL
jgi:hypothetical protein